MSYPSCKLKLKHMSFLTVLMNTFVLCAASIKCFLNLTSRIFLRRNLFYCIR